MSCAINLRRVKRSANNPTWSNRLISRDKYPAPLPPGELGHGPWHSGEGVACGSWRGGGFRDEYQSFFVPGKKYRVPGVLATGLSKMVAIAFISKADCNHPRILWCIKVDGRGVREPEHRVLHASFVQKSLIPGEGEFLYAPYSAFEVETVRWAKPDSAGKYAVGVYHQVLVRSAIDNKGWDEDLPLAPWY